MRYVQNLVVVVSAVELCVEQFTDMIFVSLLWEGVGPCRLAF